MVNLMMCLVSLPLSLPTRYSWCAGTSLSKIKRNYLDVPSRRTSQLRSLGDELHGVQRIMFDNIDAVLQRGEMISGMVIL